MEQNYEEITQVVWQGLCNNRIPIDKKSESSVDNFADEVNNKTNRPRSLSQPFRSSIITPHLSQRGMRLLLEFDSFLQREYLDCNITDMGIDIIPDDWYLVHVNGGRGDYRFYKCDQLTGLMELLGDKIKVKKRG